jgi:hypothetical protein
MPQLPDPDYPHLNKKKVVVLALIAMIILLLMALLLIGLGNAPLPPG